jgi:outer membrane protein, heavy metal efflux system
MRFRSSDPRRAAPATVAAAIAAITWTAAAFAANAAPPAGASAGGSQTVAPHAVPSVALPAGVLPPAAQQPPGLPRHFETDQNAVQALLDGLIREAIARNPELAAAGEETRAAEARIAPAGMPSDPQLGFRMKDLPTTFSLTRENATEKQILFSQSYPFPGKLALKQEVAGHDADVVRARMHATRIHLVALVRSAFAELFAVDKEIQLDFERQRMLRELVEIATNKYRVGPGLQQDVLNADVALARLDTQLIDLARRRLTREIRLANLLDEDAVHVPPLGALPPAALAHPVEQLEEMALAANPEVEERARAVKRDEAALTLARRAVLPDFQIAADYGSRNDHPPPAPTSALSRPDLMGAQIMATVPVFYYWKQSEQVAEAEANLNRSKARLAAARRATIESLLDLLARLNEHEKVAESYRVEVIPIARAAVAASISAYQVDKVDFLTMLAAQDNLDDYQTEYWRSEADRFTDLALIDEVTGAVLLEGGWKR